jgi:hypothetical protein
MDRRRVELQLRAIIVMYRIERRRRDAPTMEEFRERARSLLSSLEEDVRPHPDLRIALSAVRREINDKGTSSA